MRKSKNTSRFVFTEANIKSLSTPASGREWHYDTKQPGLALMKTSTGGIGFYFYKWHNGKPVRMLLGKSPALTVIQARDAIRKHLGRIADGGDPYADRQARRQEPTLQQLFAHWELYAAAHKKALSARHDSLNYANHLAKWGTRRLSTIKKTDVQALHSEIGAKSGPYAANRVLALLAAMFNRSEDLGYSGQNPACKIAKFKEQSRDRFLQPNELEAFFAALNAESPLFRDFFLIALLTGARKSNVMTMRWEQLNLDSCLWRIPETKGGTVVVVPLVAPAIAILKARQAEANGCEWVFPGHRRGDPMGNPGKVWKRICEAAGIKDLRIHDLRRSLGSWMAGQNTSLLIVGKALGHRTPQATAIYARLSLDPVRQAVDSAAAAMLAAGKLTNLLTIEAEPVIKVTRDSNGYE